MDMPGTETHAPAMPRHEVRATAHAAPGVRIDVADLRRRVDGEVEMLSAGVVTVVVTADGDDPDRLTRDAMAPLRELSRCGIWTVRRRGVLGMRRRIKGGWTGGDSGDDGLGGVREPRRPLPPTGHLSAEVDPTG